MNPIANQHTYMSGINCTIGLSIIRASVDYGTAYGKSAEGRANEKNMLDVIYEAVIIANNLEEKWASNRKKIILLE